MNRITIACVDNRCGFNYVQGNGPTRWSIPIDSSPEYYGNGQVNFVGYGVTKKSVLNAVWLETRVPISQIKEVAKKWKLYAHISPEDECDIGHIKWEILKWLKYMDIRG